MLLAPVVRDQKGEFRDVVERLDAKALFGRALTESLSSLPTVSGSKLQPKERHYDRSSGGSPGDR